MPFQVRLSLLDKLKIYIFKLIFSTFNRKLKSDGSFDFESFNEWAIEKGIELPFAIRFWNSKIDKVTAQWMLKNNEDRIKKVESTVGHKSKYKIDRNSKEFKINRDSFLDHLNYLFGENYTHLYIKYGVGTKPQGIPDYNQEDFSLYFGGISEKQGYFLTSNAGDFKKLEVNGSLTVDNNIKNDTSFREKNKSLISDGYSEFDECEMSGIIHYLVSKPEDSFLGAINWVKDYVTSNTFYIKIGCSKKDNNPNTPDPLKVPIKFPDNCDIKSLTSPIFTTDKNLKSLDFLPPPPDEYYDAGTGCCP